MHSVHDQPDAAGVHAPFDRILDATAEKLPEVAEYLDTARADVLALTAFPHGAVAPDLVEQPPGATGALLLNNWLRSNVIVQSAVPRDRTRAVTGRGVPPDTAQPDEEANAS